jgi:hypothetical protein
MPLGEETVAEYQMPIPERDPKIKLKISKSRVNRLMKAKYSGRFFSKPIFSMKTVTQRAPTARWDGKT